MTEWQKTVHVFLHLCVCETVSRNKLQVDITDESGEQKKPHTDWPDKNHLGQLIGFVA